jgi:hypothetical protein
MNRREFLGCSASGFGALALAQLFGTAAGQERWPAKAKRVIHLFMNGGASPMDTFDYKPELEKRHGQKFDPGQHVESVTGSHDGFPILKSPFAWKQFGESGRWVSSVFPKLATRVDDLAFLMSMTSKTNVHGPGSYMMNTGFTLPGFPCMGAWITYALGASSDDLPSFVVLPDPRGLPYNNLGNFGAGFLPVANQGVVIQATRTTPIHDLEPAPSATPITKEGETELRALLAKMDRAYAAQDEGDTRLDARVASYELAARMQLSVPELFDLKGESAATRTLYGLDEKVSEEFGTRCLLARRMLERGVRASRSERAAGAGAAGTTTPTSPRAARHASTMRRDRRGAHGRARGMFGHARDHSTEFGRQPSAGRHGRDHSGTFVGLARRRRRAPGAAYGERRMGPSRACRRCLTPRPSPPARHRPRGDVRHADRSRLHRRSTGG